MLHSHFYRPANLLIRTDNEQSSRPLPFLSRTGNVLQAFLRPNIQHSAFHQADYCARRQTVRFLTKMSRAHQCIHPDVKPQPCICFECTALRTEDSHRPCYSLNPHFSPLSFLNHHTSQTVFFRFPAGESALYLLLSMWYRKY